jgi:poly(A) polymerase
LPDRRITPEAFDPAARRAAARLASAGFLAYFAGGCVRDALLGRPSKDSDIATDANPDQVAALFPGSRYVGKAFGVTLVPVEGRFFEVATFRRDIGSADGRRPTAIEFARPEHDAARRDFTINGLFYDPQRGEIVDYVGGVADLQARVVRAIGPPRERFREDHLRMLRAVRFAVTLQFDIDPETAQAIREEASAIMRISAERILQELTRMFTESPKPGRALFLLRETALLRHILPEVEAMVGVRQPREFHPEGDVFVHTALALDRMEMQDAALAWSVLLHDVGKSKTIVVDADGRIRFPNHAIVGAEMASEILRRLRASNELREAVEHAVRNHMRFVDWPRMKPSTRRRLAAHPLFPMELELHKADCLASHGMLDIYEDARSEWKRLKSASQLPRPWLTGHDIMAMGVPEGPLVGAWLRVAFDAQLDGRFADRAALATWLRDQIRREATPTSSAADAPTQQSPSPSSDSST